MKKMRELNTADRKKRRSLTLFILVTVILVAAWAILVGSRTGFGKGQPRTNPQQSGTPRVYDYADMLTDEQEQALEERIAKAQDNIHADIVIVIMNESIEAMYPDLHYMRSDETDAYKGIKRFTESFWMKNGFGWNEPGNTGNGIIMVDNIYRESNGWVYNWVAGSGDMRFSVGNDNCEDLSQSFTDRLPMGDMPHYDQRYANALMAFVDDCDTFGSKVRSILGWSLFTPSALFAAITSSLIVTVVVCIILATLLGKMLWHLSFNGKQKKEKKKKSTLISWITGIVLLVTFFAASVVGSGLSVLVIIAYFAYFIITFIISVIRDSVKEKQKKAMPFATRDTLVPDEYQMINKKDDFVRHYVTSYTESSSSGGGHSGGGGGGGGHSGGGGGFSGGGSHR